MGGNALATALALLSLTGCLSLPPREAPDPGIEIPAEWSPAVESADEGSIEVVEPADDWWTSFGQPELDLLVEEVLAGNRDLGAAAARVDQARAEARIAGAELAPQAGLGLDASRAARNFIGLPIPGAGGVLSTTTTTFGSSLNVSWEADLWGRIRAGRAAAGAAVEASRADLAGVRLSLAGQSAKAWFALMEASRQVELARETLDSRAQTRGRIRRRFASGLASGLELRLAIANEAAAEAALAATERRRSGARRQLELLRSRYPRATPSPEAESADLPSPPRAVPGALPAALLARRPDLVAFEERLAAAGFAVHRARASLYPALRLTGSAGRASEEIEDLLDDDFSVWSLASGLLQPLFQGGRLAGGVELAEARYRELAEIYAQTLLRAFAEVELALDAEAYLERQGEALNRAASQAVAAQRLAEERYNAGIAPYLAVLEAQREASQAQSRLLEIRRLRLDARIDLHLALGGGWPEDRGDAPPKLPAEPPAGSTTGSTTGFGAASAPPMERDPR